MKLKRFIAVVEGRKRGAIGIFYRLAMTVEALTADEARQQVFEQPVWEVNHIIKLEEIKDITVL